MSLFFFCLKLIEITTTFFYFVISNFNFNLVKTQVKVVGCMATRALLAMHPPGHIF